MSIQMPSKQPTRYPLKTLAQNGRHTGLVGDKSVLDFNGKAVSEVCFECDSERRIINVDETHHKLAITGDRGGPRAVSYHNPAFQLGALRGVQSGHHVTGVYATNAEGEALSPEDLQF